MKTATQRDLQSRPRAQLAPQGQRRHSPKRQLKRSRSGRQGRISARSLKLTQDQAGTASAAESKKSRPEMSMSGSKVASKGADSSKSGALKSGTLTGLDDAQLVVQAREGREECFRTLVERYQERAFWIAYGKVHNNEDALEIAQEAFVRVHKALHRYNPNLKFYTWFYQIVTNLSIDLLRRRKKRAKVSLDDVAEAEAEGEIASANLEVQELQARVHKILDLLPDKYAEVLRLKDIEGMGAKEISELTEVTHATVRWRLHQARKLFRDAWSENYGEYHAL